MFKYIKCHLSFILPVNVSVFSVIVDINTGIQLQPEEIETIINTSDTDKDVVGAAQRPLCHS